MSFSVCCRRKNFSCVFDLVENSHKSKDLITGWARGSPGVPVQVDMNCGWVGARRWVLALFPGPVWQNPDESVVRSVIWGGWVLVRQDPRESVLRSVLWGPYGVGVSSRKLRTLVSLRGGCFDRGK